MIDRVFCFASLSALAVGCITGTVRGIQEHRHAHTMSTCTVGQTALETRSDSPSLLLCHMRVSFIIIIYIDRTGGHHHF